MNENNSQKKKKDIKHFKRFAREWAMQFLFQYDLNTETDLEKALESFLTQLNDKEIHDKIPDEKAQKKAAKTTKELVNGFLENKDQIDVKIASFSEKWTIDRMNIVDRNIMRIATYEMLFCNNVPPIVSINEAVEIGKIFGTVNSAAFINGILNSLKNTLNRPAREAVAEENQ
jgi:transcription antitermination protein NusB